MNIEQCMYNAISNTMVQCMQVQMTTLDFSSKITWFLRFLCGVQWPSSVLYRWQTPNVVQYNEWKNVINTSPQLEIIVYTFTAKLWFKIFYFADSLRFKAMCMFVTACTIQLTIGLKQQLWPLNCNIISSRSLMVYLHYKFSSS